ncbi:MAG: glutamate mutase L, partial [Nocardioidaceae bacterium]
GNVDAQPEVSSLLTDAGTPHVCADNVVPQIGVLAPDSARAAIREMFLRHVIGGKHLSKRADFTAMVRGATPDVVLTAVELLARGLGPEQPGAGDVVVVDVGGATTDVHSVVEVDPEDSGLSREVVATLPVSRTVEGDLGMRWSAVSAVEEGVAAGLAEDGRFREAAAVRQATPSYLPEDAAGRRDDLEIARLAVAVALRRHAGRAQVVFDPGTGAGVVERSGKDLREVDLLVGSGGVLRHAGADGPRVLARSIEADEGWQVPRAPHTVVDVDYVLAPAGLLAAEHPETAFRLVRSLR